MNRTLITLLVMGALGISPAAVLAADASSSGQQDESRTMGQAIDDANITASVKSKLLADRATQGLSINVTTRNGVVSLKGLVRSETEKELAEQMAANTTGVKEVQNLLTVKAEG